MEEMKSEVLRPLVCTRGIIVFPSQEVIIDVGRSKSIKAVEEAQEHFEGKVILSAQKDVTVDDPNDQQMFHVGTLCNIVHIRRMDGYIRVKFRGLKRVALHSILDENTISGSGC